MTIDSTKRAAAGVLVALLAAIVPDAGTASAAGYTRTEVNYAVPDVTLIDQDGKSVRLPEYLQADKPVLLHFIYATCTTICPVLSAGFSSFQKKAGLEPGAVRLVSISIDPENDTPEVMKEYLRKYSAKPGWDFLTGSRKDIEAVMRAFDAYVSDKMSHLPVTILKGPGPGRWVRIYGLMGTAAMIAEYQSVAGK